MLRGVARAQTEHTSITVRLLLSINRTMSAYEHVSNGVLRSVSTDARWCVAWVRAAERRHRTLSRWHCSINRGEWSASTCRVIPRYAYRLEGAHSFVCRRRRHLSIFHEICGTETNRTAGDGGIRRVTWTRFCRPCGERRTPDCGCPFILVRCRTRKSVCGCCAKSSPIASATLASWYVCTVYAASLVR